MYDPLLVMIHLFQWFVAQTYLFPSSPLFFFQLKALEDDVRVALAMLRRHINPLESPIYRLLPDLFPEIASHLRADETDLVNATHVSYHLRNTLLSHPSLWSHLNFGRETRAWAFLERSGQTPLRIDMPKNSLRTAGSFAELCRQSERVASLNLQHWWIQKKFLSESLPSLRRLEITFGYDRGWDETSDNTWGIVLDLEEDSMLWSLPSLTSLVVHDFEPTMLHTPHLTHFKFICRDLLINPHMLPSFFNNCPLLEHTDISYENKFLEFQDPVVSLPNLRTYTETTDDQVYPITLLNVLSLPPFCSITLRSGIRESEVEVDAVLPHFENPDYLAEIKRIKLGTTYGHSGEVFETVELVNVKGTKICLERCFEEEERQPLAQGYGKHAHRVAHPNFFGNLDGQSVEVLCIDGRVRPDTVTDGFFAEASGFGNVRTLILSGSAVGPCLLYLDPESDPIGHCLWFPSICTLIIHTDQHSSYFGVLRPLLDAAQKRKVVGFPFKSVSLFLQEGLEYEEGSEWLRKYGGRLTKLREHVEDLEELRGYVEELEIVVEDDVLDWDVDKYFLDGLDHLQKNRDVQWD